MKRELAISSTVVSLLPLALKTVFRTHWKTLRHHQSLYVRIETRDRSGEGEAYTLNPGAALAEARGLDLTGQDAWEIEAILERIPNRAVRSAIDLALHDLLGKTVGVPVHSLLGIPSAGRESCVSVGIDEPDRMIEAARQWITAGYPIIKVKLTTETDLAVLEEIRRIGGERLRIWVDANQAFDPKQAIAVGDQLARIGVEIFEQPLPVGQLKQYAAIRPGIPIFLDEEILSARDVAAAAAAGGIAGVNIKLAKLGGIREALRAIHVARAHGLMILLGCYFESSLGISGSTHLLTLADFVDLDAPLFLEKDPYEGLGFERAWIRASLEPGLGVIRRGEAIAG